MIKFKEECLKENTVVHLRTQEQYNIFIKWLDSINERFWNGDSYMSKNNWEYYKQDSCLYPHKGFYEEVYLFEDEGYKILSYEEAIKKDNKTILKIVFFPLYIIFKLFKKWRAWDKWEEETYRQCNNGQEDYDFD